MSEGYYETVGDVQEWRWGKEPKVAKPEPEPKAKPPRRKRTARKAKK